MLRLLKNTSPGQYSSHRQLEISGFLPQNRKAKKLPYINLSVNMNISLTYGFIRQELK